MLDHEHERFVAALDSLEQLAGAPEGAIAALRKFLEEARGSSDEPRGPTPAESLLPTPAPAPGPKLRKAKAEEYTEICDVYEAPCPDPILAPEITKPAESST